MRIFILDDEINQHPRNILLTTLSSHDLTVATNSFEAAKIYTPPYDLLLLDHDMRGFYDDPEYEDTGYQFVKWLVAKELERKPQVILHSQNSEGRLVMMMLLSQYKFRVQEFAFSHAYVNYLQENYGSNTPRPAKRLLQGRA